MKIKININYNNFYLKYFLNLYNFYKNLLKSKISIFLLKNIIIYLKKILIFIIN